MNHTDYTQRKKDTVEHALTRTCDHKGCKRVICNHAFNDLCHEIDQLIDEYIIGEDEHGFGKHGSLCSSKQHEEIKHQNQLRADQRNIIKGDTE